MCVCRICLSGKPDKDILQSVKVSKNNDEKTFAEILMFCLNIQVEQHSSNTKLCLKCINKLLSFHKFKSLALKNDAHLRSLDVKNEVFIKEDEIKSESTLYDNLQDEEKIEQDEKEEAIEDEPTNGAYLKLEHHDPNSNLESDEELLSVIKTIKYGYKSNKTIKRAKTLKKRHKTSSSESNVKHICEECGKTVIDLKAHSYLHQPLSARKRIKCHKCDKMFSSHSARYKHNKIKHLGIKQICNICKKEVTQLKQHKLVVHEKGSLPYECIECGRRFISKSLLEMHTRMHTKDRPFNCELCDKNFGSKYLMLQHKRSVHDKEKSHLCQLCSKSFFKKYHLHVHLKSHTKEKSFECPECGKFYKTQATLKGHRETHGGVKNFACELCSQAFMKREYLLAHMLSHTKEKRYPCQYCGVKFHRSDHRKRHEYTAHQKHLIASNTTST